jgi:hypothetical protein
LLLDLDAEKGVTVEEGDRVVSWENQAPGPGARLFVKRDEGRKEPGSGRPQWRRNIPDIGGRSALVFRQQELVCMDEDTFDNLTRGKGCTWIAVLAVHEQRVGLKDVNSFFGNLRNAGMYEGVWGCLDDDNTLWWGMRNGLSFGRFDANNPKVSGPRLEAGRFQLVAGRIAAGTGRVDLDLFVGGPRPVATAPIAVNPEADPSRMAIGQERDAIQHPGHESFDGEVARFLIFERPLTEAEMKTLLASLRSFYHLDGAER